jgi:catechol 2,3-dioxygenase-like lactoylglutathione lyase family enzyme
MEHIIPVFKCKSLEPTLTFYQALGFEVTYSQDRPNIYAAVTRSETNLHFTKRAEAGFCLINVPDVTVYHKAYADGLRTEYGSIPTAGNPRITRLREGQTRFYLFDPSGNLVLYVNVDEPNTDYDRFNNDQSPLEKALDMVAFLRDTYVDDAGAAKHLDKALAKYPDAPALERARLLAARAEIAVAMDDAETAANAEAQLAQITLSAEDRDRYQAELTAADRLKRWRTDPV